MVILLMLVCKRPKYYYLGFQKHLKIWLDYFAQNTFGWFKVKDGRS